jgi:hypothetical protein
MSSVPGQDRRLVSNHADGVPVEPREAHDEVLGPSFLHLEELPVVHHALYGLSHVVGTLGRVGDERGEPPIHPLRVVGRPVVRGALEVVLGRKRAGSGRLRGRSPRRARRSARRHSLCCACRRRQLFWVTSSPVTLFITSGPVMNMWLVSSTMKMKSVIAGE